jgi:hypothetical protein
MLSIGVCVCVCVCVCYTRNHATWFRSSLNLKDYNFTKKKKLDMLKLT